MPARRKKRTAETTSASLGAVGEEERGREGEAWKEGVGEVRGGGEE